MYLEFISLELSHIFKGIPDTSIKQGGRNKA